MSFFVLVSIIFCKFAPNYYYWRKNWKLCHDMRQPKCNFAAVFEN